MFHSTSIPCDDGKKKLFCRGVHVYEASYTPADPGVYELVHCRFLQLYEHTSSYEVGCVRRCVRARRVSRVCQKVCTKVCQKV
jgi:hypothetical protein